MASQIKNELVLRQSQARWLHSHKWVPVQTMSSYRDFVWQKGQNMNTASTHAVSDDRRRIDERTLPQSTLNALWGRSLWGIVNCVAERFTVECTKGQKTHHLFTLVDRRTNKLAMQAKRQVCPRQCKESATVCSAYPWGVAGPDPTVSSCT